jgi:hypothetical protein
MEAFNRHSNVQRSEARFPMSEVDLQRCVEGARDAAMKSISCDSKDIREQASARVTEALAQKQEVLLRANRDASAALCSKLLAGCVSDLRRARDTARTSEEFASSAMDATTKWKSTAKGPSAEGGLRSLQDTIAEVHRAVDARLRVEAAEREVKCVHPPRSAFVLLSVLDVPCS